MANILIKNGYLIADDHAKPRAVDIAVQNGMIAGINNIADTFVADTVIDARQQYICAGLIDLATHLREPGYEYKATIASETRACAKAGITTVCCLPDTDPIIDTPAVAELIIKRAHQAGFCRVIPMGALTKNLEGKQLSEMVALHNAGCVILSNANFPVLDTAILRHCFEYAATFGICVMIRPEDYWLARQGCMHEGRVSTRLGLNGIPEAAESIEVARCLQLAEQTGVKMHFSQLTTAAALKLVAQAKKDRLQVTADVAAHHLVLSEMDVLEYQTQCHVRPPLRSLSDRDALIEGIKSGVIDAVVSAHQPHEKDAKLQPFADSSAGISALETLLPIVLKVREDHKLGWYQAMSLVTENPSRILGLKRGQIEVGQVADLCIFDPEKYFVLNEKEMWSQGKNTPFLGWEFKGKVNYTLLGGRIVYGAN